MNTQNEQVNKPTTATEKFSDLKQKPSFQEESGKKMKDQKINSDLAEDADVEFDQNLANKDDAFTRQTI